MDICTARRAICLFFNEKVEILESYNDSIHSPSTKLSLPSIIKLRNFVKYHKLDVILTRRNVLVRDNHQCQYFYRQDAKKLTHWKGEAPWYIFVFVIFVFAISILLLLI